MTTSRFERPTSARSDIRRRPRWLDAAIVAALVSLAVAILVTFVRSGDPTQNASQAQAATTSTAPTTQGDPATEPLPDLIPLPGEIREEGGTLWWSSRDCHAASLDLASGAVRELRGIEREHCRLWPAGDGGEAVAVTAKRAAALEGKGLVLVGGAEDPRLVFHTRGFLASEVAWNADGSAFAVCFGTRDGVVTDTFVGGGDRREIGGACFPGWLADGRLVLARSDPVSVRVAGKTLIDGAEIARLLPSLPKRSRRAVSALATAGRTVAAALVVVSKTQLLPSAAALVVVSQGGRETYTARLRPRTLPAALGLAPDGSGLWYFDTADGKATVLSIPGGRRFPVFDARWIAWSPGGSYLAAATEKGIELRSWPQGDRLAVIPVSASDVSWTRQAGR